MYLWKPLGILDFLDLKRASSVNTKWIYDEFIYLLLWKELIYLPLRLLKKTAKISETTVHKNILKHLCFYPKKILRLYFVHQPGVSSFASSTWNCKLQLIIKCYRIENSMKCLWMYGNLNSFKLVLIFLKEKTINQNSNIA